MTSAVDRLFKFINIPGECWEWTGKIDRHGYGHFHMGQRKWLAHRASYSLLKGDIPSGVSLDHLCRNTRCVNPDHLDPCDLKTNRARVPARTHCKNGHEYTAENTKLRGNTRICRTCNRIAVSTYKTRRVA